LDHSRDPRFDAVREQVSGRYRADLKVWAIDDTATSQSGALWYRDGGQSLDRMREVLGGDEGFVLDPQGERHFISLTPWLDSDPETTRFIVLFEFEPSEDQRSKFQELMQSHFSPQKGD
jgi:hypothetical protein